MFSAYRGNQAFVIYRQKQMVFNDIDSITKYDNQKNKYLKFILGNQKIYYPLFGSISDWKGVAKKDLGATISLRHIFSEPFRQDFKLINKIDKEYLYRFDVANQKPFWLFIIIMDGEIVDENLLELINNFRFTVKKNKNYSIYWYEFSNA